MIVVQNLSVPLDRRVYDEALALSRDGWTVRVICPRSSQNPAAFEMCENIAVYRHWLPQHGGGQIGFLWEYVCSLLFESILLLRIYMRHGFDIVQVCNPPDILIFAVLPYKFAGVKVVYDRHDDVPALFAEKFGGSWLGRLLRFAERFTVRMADIVLCASGAHHADLVERKWKDRDRVHTILSVPDFTRFRRTSPDIALRRRRSVTLGYLGIIGTQDSVERVVQCLGHLIHDLGEPDVQAIIVGDGSELPRLRRLAQEIGVMEHVSFTGMLTGDRLLQAVSAFDIGIIPDRKNAFTDGATMNKVFEYAACGLPIVSSPLLETQLLLGDHAVFAEEDTALSLAEACLLLIRSPEERQRIALPAKHAVTTSYSAAREAQKYVAALSSLAPT